MVAFPTLPSRRVVVAVIGASEAPPALLEHAEAAGRAVARRGWNLLCGGGAGVMEAACRGFASAREPGAVSIGLLPGDDAAAANPFADIALPTGLGMARNAVIARAAEGLIAVGGCAGTLSEIALAWQMGKTIAVIAPSGGWSGRLAGQALDSRRSDGILSAATGEEAATLLEPLLRRGDRR